MLFLRRFNTNIDPSFNPFKACFNMTGNVALRNVQYKILHNTYPTLKHLFLWRIKQSPNCTACNIPETTIHAIWDCTIAQTSINNMQQVYRTLTGIDSYIINKEEFIYGYRNDKALNTIFTLIKKRLILQREEKLILTNGDIISIIKDEMAVEKYISTKNKSINGFNKKWCKFFGLKSGFMLFKSVLM